VFTKSPSVKGLDDVIVKWDISKLTLTTCTEEYFVGITLPELEKLRFVL
jgi:hypothetical protein